MTEHRNEVWSIARKSLDGLPGDQGLNIAHEAVDRHLGTERELRTAIRWLGKHGERDEITYADLAERTARFANALEGLGIERGEVVFGLTGRVPLLYVAALGTLKRGAVFSPLFAAFGPEPIRHPHDDRQRPRAGHDQGAVRAARWPTSATSCPTSDTCSSSTSTDDADAPAGTRSLPALLAASDAHYEIGPTDPEHRALLHFTSGTTGKPKGAIHVHEAVVAHHATGEHALDLRDGDVFWCTADPGWVTGTSYGIISPLTHGVTMVVDEAEFDAERWYGILRDEGVNVWYTAPTAVRMLMRAGHGAGRWPRPPRAALRRQRRRAAPPRGGRVGDRGARHADPRQLVADRDRRDHDRQPPGPGDPARLDGPAAPGCRGGRPRRGRRAAPSGVDDGGYADARADPARPASWRCGPAGRRCSAATSARTSATGSASSAAGTTPATWSPRDADGYLWFVGRGDDVIKSAGHLIGPFEVEAVLLEHPAVVEAGVIGVPDEVAGEIVKAFVTVADGYTPDDALRRELLGPRPIAARPRGGPTARSPSTRTCPRPGAARSCAGCSRRGSSGSTRATRRPWSRPPTDEES